VLESDDYSVLPVGAEEMHAACEGGVLRRGQADAAVTRNACHDVSECESNGYGVRESRLWCKRVTVMVLESNGYGVGA
jgi:hypothetical protein